MSKVHEILQKAEIDWQELFEGMTMGFAVHRVVRNNKKKVVDCVILKVNREFEKLTHRDRDQIEGVSFSKTIRTGGPNWIKRYADVVDTGKPLIFETDSFEEGKTHRVRAFKTGPETFAAMYTEISAEKSTETSLAGEKNLTKTIVDSIADYIFSKDVKGKYLECNKVFADLFMGKPKKEIIGKTDKELFGKKNKAMVSFMLTGDREVFREEKAVRIEWESKLANGEVVTLDTLKTPLKDESGKIIGLVGVSRDVTEKNKAEVDLIEKAKIAEILNKVMVDREIRMIELKKEIAVLKKGEKQ